MGLLPNGSLTGNGGLRKVVLIMKIAIIDYGLGNLRSVKRGLEKAGANPIITSQQEEIAAGDGLVLPGVGS